MIVVFGSLTVDLLMPVPTLPRPGETVLGEAYETQPGGKGANQAAAAARAGASVRFHGALGDDAFGALSRAALAASGVDVSGIATVDRPTAAAAVLIGSDGANQIAVAAGANLAARAGQVRDADLAPGTTLLLQMEVPAAENWALLRRARARGARTVLNVAPALPVPGDALALVDILVVNEIEAAMLAGGLGLGVSEPEALAATLATRCGGVAAVTLGPAGSIAAGPGGIVRTAALPVEVRDTTGAGDAWTGAFAAALDAGCDLALALRHGSVGGSLACRALGARAGLAEAAEIASGVRDLP